jgi:hypothetical protein
MQTCLREPQAIHDLALVFTDPVRANIRWDDVEGLLKAIGCIIVEGAGSAVSFEFEGVVVRFHRPHPGKEAKRYQVRDAREFLTKIGVRP